MQIFTLKINLLLHKTPPKDIYFHLACLHKTICSVWLLDNGTIKRRSQLKGIIAVQSINVKGIYS